mmetsp:Transcript_2280/g.2642  ORF Transcript_2280/g.2642 Transcript_2280/m.2642 type:complete len:376 (-) Transcript_2280:2303-3430(-)|eukprot:CAMPEP_0194370360 /NCGR_PEP_ID=MMETSP0174-20130528/18640_1 /TAXON_ID=216777 /ORGANISM="Proboscia alata, Strain PI-D3" /LENGTH=375 /DNA_ID=CAMNT_0039147759 /DNA_START=64 /DNA_END=1191 /DNA_ORIENTATION=-
MVALSSKTRPNRSRAGSSFPKLKAIILVVLLLVAVLFLDVGIKLENALVAITDTTEKPSVLHASADNYSLAKSQSFGFFDGVRNNEWERLQSIVAVHEDHKYPEQPLTHNPIWDNPLWNKRVNEYFNSNPAWWQTNYEPNFSCRFERRIGGVTGNGDGPKWICDPHRIAELAKERKAKDPNHPGCVIYSVGSNGDFGFEWGMEQEVGPGVCEFHIFDMGNYTEKMNEQNLKKAHFHQWGLAQQDPKSEDPKPGDKFYGLRDTIKLLGHENLETIDIFKIDCEKCEWGTYQDWVAPGIPSLQQIQVELHNAPTQAIAFFDTMEEAGYVRFHKEPNIQFNDGSCIEYAFLKLEKEFFSLRNEKKQEKKDAITADKKG